ncbi:hypothetical protein Tco_0425078 [Tanacetum coccineum]
MMLNSIEHGPLVYDTIKVDGVIRTKKYEELKDAVKLQDHYDVKATNIILQGLPPKVYSLVNHHHGKSLHDYDMHTIGMTMQHVQFNAKFLNTLPPEWSKFVTDVKLARNLHTTNYDQLYSYLSQHEAHATKVRLMHERFPDPLALISNNSHIPSYQTNHQSQYNPTHYQQHSSPLAQQYYHSQQHSQSYEAPSHYKQYQPPAITQQPSVPQNVYQSSAMSQQTQAKFPPLDSGLAVPSFLPEHLLIQETKQPFKMVGLQSNKCMGDRVKVLLVLQLSRRKTYGKAMHSAKVAKEFNMVQGENIASSNTGSWLGIDDLNAFDLDCDEEPCAKAIQMANLLVMINVILEDNESLMTTIDVLKTQSKEKEAKYIDKEIDFEKKIKELENIVFKVGQSAQTMHMLTKRQVFYDHTHKQALGYQNSFYLKKVQRIKPTLYDGVVISRKHDVISVVDSE